MYNTWAYRCAKHERNRILSSDRDIDGPYRHSLLSTGKRDITSLLAEAPFPLYSLS